MNEKYQLLKSRLRDVIAENDNLGDKLEHYKRKARLLAMEKEYSLLISLLLGKMCTMDTELMSSDTDGSESYTKTDQPEKKKRAKRTSDTPVKVRKVQNIAMLNNKPILPVQIGIVTLISLGQICTLPSYHTERYIYPIGFCTSR